MIPEAKAFSDRNFGMLIASDHFCPNGGKPFALNSPTENIRFVTCHCEDHCNWYKCRLEKPPSDCLDGVNASWKWDKKGNNWVAQMITGTQMGNDGQMGFIILRYKLFLDSSGRNLYSYLLLFLFIRRKCIYAF